MHAARPRRWLALYAGFLAALLAVAFAAGEVVVRLRGGAPWNPAPAALRVDPGGRLYRTDPELGYALLPGSFRIRFPTGLAFTATHDADGLRIARPPDARAASGAPAVWIFGGSFAYGWAVDDDASLPWQLQLARPDVEVVSFAVNGYGTLQAAVSLERALRERSAPAVVVLTYASFHDERNTFTRRRGKRVAPFNRLGPLVQPYARLGPGGELEIAMAEATYRPWPGQRHSALVHRLEQLWNELERRRVDSAAVTRALVARIVAAARASGARPLVATLTADAAAAAVRAHAEGLGAETVDLAIDLDAPGMRNLPHDGHPSPLAQRRYARRLSRALGAIASTTPPAR